MTHPERRVLYRHPLSGHAHRVELFLSILGLAHERVEVDLRAGQQKSPEFLEKNVFGQVPVLEDGPVTLADSNAILVYLAQKYDAEGRWLPREPAAAARVQQWLSVAAGPLAYGPGAARRAKVFRAPLDLSPLHASSAQLFGTFERVLATQAFFVGARATIANLALYTYTAHAPEGGVSLAPYPQIRAWLARIEALPGFIPMQRTPTGDET